MKQQCDSSAEVVNAKCGNQWIFVKKCNINVLKNHTFSVHGKFLS